MANLTGSPSYQNTITAFDTTTAASPANMNSLQQVLLNNTKYLKDHIDTLEALNISTRLTSLETSRTTDQGRITTLEASFNLDKRFPISASGELTTASTALTPNTKKDIHTLVLTLPIGKILKIKRVRYGLGITVSTGAGIIPRFQLRNKLVPALDFTSSTDAGEQVLTQTLADNSGGLSPLTVKLAVSLFNTAGATDNIVTIDGAGFWAELTIE